MATKTALEKAAELRGSAKKFREMAAGVAKWSIGSSAIRSKLAAGYVEIADNLDHMAAELEATPGRIVSD